jgi:hypothetical protein
MHVAEKALDLAARIKPMLAGNPPGVQSGALVELVALFLAGHPPEVRESVAAVFLDAVMEMVPVVERELGMPWQGASSAN